MKTLSIAVACTLVAFVAGVLATKQAMELSALQHENGMIRYYRESQTAFALINIRHALADDLASVLRTNCQIAKSSVLLLDPSAHESPGKQRDIEKLRGDALAAIDSLKASGKCGPRQ